jgi:NADH-quinone oxidoreductase subunit J
MVAGLAPDWILFWIMAPISVVSAGAMLFQRNAVHAALLLVVNFFTLAVFFLILGAPFLFVVQIIVYAGAIMVLFLFVIMLLGVDRHETLTERIRGQRPLALLLAAGLVTEVVLAVRLGVGISTRAAPNFDEVVNKGGNVRALAKVLFNGFFFPFEVTSVLLIVAAVAAMVLTRQSERGPIGGPGSATGPVNLGRGNPPTPEAAEPETVA